MDQNRKKSSPASKEQRDKISAAMKKKWKDAAYRKKALEGMEAYRDALPPKKPKKIVSRAASTINLDDVFAVAPMKKGTAKKKRKRNVKISSSTVTAKKKVKKKKKKKQSADGASGVQLATAAKVMKSGIAKPNKKNGKKEKKEDGDISVMREERRDLYDLLYGDEGGATSDDEDDDDEDFEEEEFIPVIPDPESEPDNAAMALFAAGGVDDENLDDYDPYGLDDC